MTLVRPIFDNPGQCGLVRAHEPEANLGKSQAGFLNEIGEIQNRIIFME